MDVSYRSGIEQHQLRPVTREALRIYQENGEDAKNGKSNPSKALNITHGTSSDVFDKISPHYD
ncbi:unnamed protein product [Arabis nemorensis]|uniref:Uncharacterized protein n=1 Tax=Arabis nemorensis TaxID=586526 RepID=A0A565AVE4_9BRAS|nr:unnamed protein product [Arabis nemorensis]